LGDDGVALGFAPFFLRLFGAFPRAIFPGAVEVIHALGAWTGEHPADLRIAEYHTFAGAVSGGVQQLCDRAFAPVLQE